MAALRPGSAAFFPILDTHDTGYSILVLLNINPIRNSYIHILFDLYVFRFLLLEGFKRLYLRF